MTKVEYMQKLLDLCSEKQKDVFKKMYPNGPDIKQLKWAITQIENTLAKGNKGTELLRDQITELKAAIVGFSGIKANFRRTITGLERDLKLAENKIQNLSTSTNIESAFIQERLSLLQALEAGGVDNWEWYDEATKDL